MNLLAYTKKLYDKINFYDRAVKNAYPSYSSNPFCRPVNVTIIWVDDKKDDNRF